MMKAGLHSTLFSIVSLLLLHCSAIANASSENALCHRIESDLVVTNFTCPEEDQPSNWTHCCDNEGDLDGHHCCDGFSDSINQDASHPRKARSVSRPGDNWQHLKKSVAKRNHKPKSSDLSELIEKGKEKIKNVGKDGRKAFESGVQQVNGGVQELAMGISEIGQSFSEKIEPLKGKNVEIQNSKKSSTNLASFQLPRVTTIGSMLIALSALYQILC